MTSTDGIRKPHELWAVVADPSQRGATTIVNEGLLFAATDEPQRWLAVMNRGRLEADDVAALEQMLLQLEKDPQPGRIMGYLREQSSTEPGALKLASRGERHALSTAFTWSSSPQDFGYWATLQGGGRPYPEGLSECLRLWASERREVVDQFEWGGAYMDQEQLEYVIPEGEFDREALQEWIGARSKVPLHVREDVDSSKERLAGRTYASLMFPLGVAYVTAVDLGLDGPGAPSVIAAMEGEAHERAEALDRWEHEAEGIPPTEAGQRALSLFSWADLDGDFERAMIRLITRRWRETYVRWPNEDALRHAPNRQHVAAATQMVLGDGKLQPQYLSSLRSAGGAAIPGMPGLNWLVKHNQEGLKARLKAVMEACGEPALEKT